MNLLTKLYDQILLEKKKKKKASKHKWNPKKHYRNSTYAFVPQAGIEGFGGGDVGGMIGGADGG